MEESRHFTGAGVPRSWLERDVARQDRPPRERPSPYRPPPHSPWPALLRGGGRSQAGRKRLVPRARFSRVAPSVLRDAAFAQDQGGQGGAGE